MVAGCLGESKNGSAVSSFLRILRRGSPCAAAYSADPLLDTVLRLGGTGLADMWQDTLDRLRGLTPSIGEVPQLKQIRADIRERMARFVSLSPGEEVHGLLRFRPYARESPVRLFGFLLQQTRSVTVSHSVGSVRGRSTSWFSHCLR